jgi:hypothetical protein
LSLSKRGSEITIVPVVRAVRVVAAITLCAMAKIELPTFAIGLVPPLRCAPI